LTSLSPEKGGEGLALYRKMRAADEIAEACKIREETTNLSESDVYGEDRPITEKAARCAIGVHRPEKKRKKDLTGKVIVARGKKRWWGWTEKNRTAL